MFLGDVFSPEILCILATDLIAPVQNCRQLTPNRPGWGSHQAAALHYEFDPKKSQSLQMVWKWVCPLDLLYSCIFDWCPNGQPGGLVP